MNLLHARRDESRLLVGDARVPVARNVPDTAAEVVLGGRSEDLRLSGESQAALAIDIDLIEELGSDTHVYGSLARTENDGRADADSNGTADRTGTAGRTGTVGHLGDRPFVVRLPKGSTPMRGDRMWLELDPERARIFDPETQLAIA